jgi:membrane fusion protein, multidrug efflux system
LGLQILAIKTSSFRSPLRAWIIGAALILIVIIFGAAHLRSTNSANAAARAASAAVPVSAATVATRTLQIRLTTVGNVEAYTTVAVKARVDGQIKRVHFREGDRVAKDAPLFEIDPRPFEAGLRQAEANLDRDRALLANAVSQRRRYEDLLKKGFISEEAFNQIKTNFDSANAVVRADEANVENLRLQLEYAHIRSPIDGVAGRVLIQEGNLVRANDTNALVMLNQVTPIYVAFAAPEQHLATIRAGMTKASLKVIATIADSKESAEGKLTFIDNGVDTTTGTVKLKGEFANRDRKLWPGQFVNVVLNLYDQAEAIVVPGTAIQNGPEGPIAFVIRADQTVELRKVRVDRNDGDMTVIAAGLKPGEIVVTEGQLRLTDHAKVNVVKGATQ